jgi:hypothetical protein
MKDVNEHPSMIEANRLFDEDMQATGKDYSNHPQALGLAFRALAELLNAELDAQEKARK